VQNFHDDHRLAKTHTLSTIALAEFANEKRFVIFLLSFSFDLPKWAAMSSLWKAAEIGIPDLASVA
jgi:hypothetical protein